MMYYASDIYAAGCAFVLLVRLPLTRIAAHFVFTAWRSWQVGRRPRRRALTVHWHGGGGAVVRCALEPLLLTDCRLNVHYPARQAILPVTHDALTLAQQMLHTDHSQRPTAQECLKSAYFIDSSTVAVADKENIIGKRKLASAASVVRSPLRPVVK